MSLIRKSFLNGAAARQRAQWCTAAVLLLLCVVGGAWSVPAAAMSNRIESPPAPANQSLADVARKSIGCLRCHTQEDAPTMHDSPAVRLGCTDCHGGDASVIPPYGLPRMDLEYIRLRDRAHVLPRFPKAWGYPHGALPQRSYTLLNKESSAFIRFINPSDYRVVNLSCGACHASIIAAAERSMMATGVMLWGAAAYNNGILPFKRYVVGEAYTTDGKAAVIKGPPLPDPQSALAHHGVLPELLPLPEFESVPAAQIFRIFERGGRVSGNRFPEIALPNVGSSLQTLNEPGRNDIHASNRARGTGASISIPVLNVNKTRLNDPFMWFLGTNDNPGDYRSSGCAGCHVVFANDRDPKHSGPYAAFGNMGETQTDDPVIPRHVSGYPVYHRFTTAIPTSQCMVCHMHQPNVFMNTYMGYTMWDYEADAPFMWPKKQRYPTAAEIRAVNARDPEGAAPRGLWASVKFLANVSKLNPKLHITQFADYHGHGWNFRGVFKKARDGTLLDAKGNPISPNDPNKWKKAVLLASIHMEKGMHCVDCHYAQDNHGNGYIYGEVAQAIEISCIDCHGTYDAYPTLRTSGPAAPPEGTDLALLRNPDGKLRFFWRNGKLYQRSVVTPGLVWRIHLVKDSLNPKSPDYNPRAARAKLMSTNTATQEWGLQVPKSERAHPVSDMECYTCHTSWTTSCAGCHLPAEQNWKVAAKHYEGTVSRVYTTYNPQVARDQMFQLGRRGPTDGGRIAPIRSSSALVVSSTNINREHVYIQQPPISSAGFSSQAFNPHFPHTVRLTETKTCDDCHLSAKNDNNAIMAQLLLQGTNFVNFIGYYAWLGTGNGVTGVKVTEWNEPQAVIGSYLQRYAYPDDYRKHFQVYKGRLQEAHHHGGPPARCLQLRGEYLYTAESWRGMQVYDVASIGNKGISERILTSPTSPLGDDTRIPSPDATCVALPTNQPIDPPRDRGYLMRVINEEQPFHPIYNYALITDSKQGLILTNVDTLADGNPLNNHLRRALTWNPGGILDGARHLTIGGYYVYVACNAGLVILNLNHPLHPFVESVVPLPDVRASALQFRYLFVTDRDGLRSIEITDKKHPRVTPGFVPLADAQRVYVARTYAYVADGKDGLAIVNVTQPENMKLYQMFNGGGQLKDTHDVVVGTTNASLFAYVADGVDGLKVLQLTSPESQPKLYGFSPEPKPQVIASYRTSGPALALSKGLDRDRAVDETGDQIAVFGRIGSRPFTLKEMEKLYLNKQGKPWFVKDE